MKKFPLIIVILLILGLFVSADYFLNNMDSSVALEDIKNQEESTNNENKDEKAGFTGTYYKIEDEVLGYKVISQVQTSQIFEKIDLNSINSIKTYRNRLDKTDGENTKTIYLYEIHGPKDQGSLTYLHTKLQFIAQIDGINETINEVGTFGHNSFFFNDDNYKNTAFLLVQINDDLYGFQFNKTDSDTGEDSMVYEDVKKIISNMMPSNEADDTNTTS